MERAAFVGGFFYPVEARLKTRFVRLCSSRALSWIDDSDRRDEKERTPDAIQFGDLLRNVLKMGATRVRLYLADPYGVGTRQTFQRVLDERRSAHPAVTFELAQARLGPLDGISLEGELTEFFGQVAAEPLVTADDFADFLEGGRVLCVSSTRGPSFETTMKYTPIPVEIQQCAQEIRLRPRDRALGATLREAAARYRRLLYAHGNGLGPVPYAAQLPWASRIHQGRNPIEVLQSVLHTIHDRREYRSLQAARTAQQGLLPSELPQVPGVEISASWQPSQIVSGDYYDAFELTSGRISLVIADVSGKGTPAALCMAALQGALRALAPRGGSPREVCLQADTVIRSRATGRHITCFFGELDTSSLVLRYTNAGHSPLPLLLRAEGTEVEELKSHGFPLGMALQGDYEEGSVQLIPGDCLVLITDGLTDVCNSKSEEFGVERVRELALKSRHLPAAAIQSVLIESARQFGDGYFGDDATVMVVRITSPESPPY